MNQRQAVSAEEPDWSREARRPWEWSPSHALISSLRDYQKYATRSGIAALVVRKVAVLRHRFWSAVTGAEIPLNCRLGGGLLLPHPNGVVIHPEATIGANCLIFQQVTIGASGSGLPTIGGHVDIGAGAKVIGPIRIGNHAVIGANALVVFDVPDGGVVLAPTACIAPASPGSARANSKRPHD
jgi:serine O-acetyltransferase